MRKKKFIKIGLYAYVILLFAGTSYALFQRDPITFQVEVRVRDTRPPELPEPMETPPPIEQPAPPHETSEPSVPAEPSEPAEPQEPSEPSEPPASVSNEP